VYEREIFFESELITIFLVLVSIWFFVFQKVIQSIRRCRPRFCEDGKKIREEKRSKIFFN